MVVTMKIRQRRFKKSWFHEGRGAGKTDPPGGSRKACFFGREFFGKGSQRKLSKERMGWVILGRIASRGGVLFEEMSFPSLSGKEYGWSGWLIGQRRASTCSSGFVVVTGLGGREKKEKIGC